MQLRWFFLLALIVSRMPAANSTLRSESIGDFRLESGKILPDCKISYRSFGQLNADRSNVVVIPTWFNGVSEDWERFIGPGGLVDSSLFYVIVVDALGNGNSTSPSNSPTLKGSKYPALTIHDMVESQHRLLVDKLGLSQVHALMGVSMGGMQTLEWLVSFPEFMKKGVVIVGTPKMTDKDVELWSTAFNIGSIGKKSGKTIDWAGTLSQAAGMYQKYKEPFNALRQFEAIARHDISRRTENSLEKAAAQIRARTLFVVATEDKAVSPQLPLQFAGLLHSRLVELTGPCGHKAYDCEKDKIAPPINEFLSDGAEPVPATPPVRKSVFDLSPDPSRN